ncbi:Transposable element Tcb1 transposase [Anthophora quadrimaculata]
MSPHTAIQVRKVVVKLSREGKSSREISVLLAIDKTPVNNILNKFKTTGSLADRPRSGRPRKTTARVDKLIRRKSVVDVRKTAGVIAQELHDENLADVSRITASRRLRDVGLFGRVGVKKPLISTKNQRARLQFAKNYQCWTVQDWKKVLFSDESKFKLFGSDGKQYVRRPVGTRYNSKYQIPPVKHGGGGAMVWGAFSYEGVGPLVEIEGVMDCFVYKDILDKQMLPFAKDNMPDGWIFQHDTDPKHASKIVSQYLSAKNVRVLEWPAQSPDLNPIEHLWDKLGRRVTNKKHSNKRDLFKTLSEEWNKIPRDTIIGLIESMPRRCAAVIIFKGMATKY